jgi:hypothetical protein
VVREWWANVGNGSTAAAEVVIKEGITKEMLVTTSFFYRRERDTKDDKSNATFLA